MSERPAGSPASTLWSAKRFRQLVIILLVAAILGVVAWLLWPALTTSDEVRDARTVFCTQRSERTAFADAAVALDIAEASTADRVSVNDVEISVMSWRTGHEVDFDRACDAFVAMRNVPVAAGVSTISPQPFLLAALTTALALVSTSWKDRTARNQSEADALRDNVKAFAEAANAYLEGFVAFPPTVSPAAMDSARGELVGRLRGVHRKHSTWQLVRDVIGLLDSGELHAPGAELSRLQDTASRTSRIDALKTRVAEVAGIGNEVANAHADRVNADPRLRQPLIETSKQ